MGQLELGPLKNHKHRIDGENTCGQEDIESERVREIKKNTKRRQSFNYRISVCMDATEKAKLLHSENTQMISQFKHTHGIQGDTLCVASCMMIKREAHSISALFDGKIY